MGDRRGRSQPRRGWSRAVDPYRKVRLLALVAEMGLVSVFSEAKLDADGNLPSLGAFITLFQKNYC